MPNKRAYIAFASIFCVVVVGAVVGITVWLMNRPENIDVVQSTMEESMLSLIKVGDIASGLEGFVRVDSSFLLENPQNISHHLTINVTDGYPAGVDTIDFHFTKEMNPATLPDTTFAVKDVQSLTFPYRLDAEFDPSKWRGGLFIERSSSAVVGAIPFTIDLSIAAEDGNDQNEMMNLSNSTDATNSTGGMAMNANVATDPPAATIPPTPPILVSRLEGRGYRVGGTITVTYRTDFINGEIVQIPVLMFQGIQAPVAPGPFLYLTRRPGNPRTLASNDIRVPIMGATDGSFTIEGSFEQDFTFDVDLNEFTSGSWIVWCDPFGIHLGGGTISVAEESF